MNDRDPNQTPAAQPDPIDTETTSVLEHLGVVGKITKDLKDAASKMTRHEARFLVDSYYQRQDERVRASNQLRATQKDGEPNRALHWLVGQADAIETRVATLLSAYAQGNPLGQWALSITGIGPVLAAGLLAHISERSLTPGHLYAFAGLDPKQKWLGAKADDLVSEAFKNASTPGQALVAISLVSGRRPFEICKLSDADFEEPDRITVARAIAEASAIDKDQIQQRTIQAIHADNAIREFCAAGGADVAAVYDALLPKLHLHKSEIATALKRRPWNAALKLLCWKIGKSFVYTCTNEKSFYGPYYQKRKEYEQRRNDTGELAQQAADKLKNYRIGKTTEAYGHYSAGRLPPAHIHARACRWTVKLFLAHFWEVYYFTRTGKRPTMAPYPIAHLGHIHYIAPPNMHVLEGMADQPAPYDNDTPRQNGTPKPAYLP